MLFEMFPTNINSSEHSLYDFQAPENASKWDKLFVKALQQVQRQVHPSLIIREDALDYIEKLILQLLNTLCMSQPHTIKDVTSRVEATFPYPIDKWADKDANSVIEKGKKKSPLVLPLDKIHSLLVKDVLKYKIDNQVTMYIVAVLEYIAADILKLTGNYVKNIKHHEITLQDIRVAMCADKVLMDMFFQDDEDTISTYSTISSHSSVFEEEPSKANDQSYEQIVKDLILEEKQYIRDLNMIIKVFREPFCKLFPNSQDPENIFSNIQDIHELSYNVLSLLEDTLEVTEDNGVPLVGTCFEELAEGAEFDVYEKYTEDVLKPKCKDRLNTLVNRHDVCTTLQSAGHGFKEAVKYVLPKLLFGPIFHCLHYFDVMKKLRETSDEEEDIDSLDSAFGMMHLLKLEIEKKLNAANLLKRKQGDFMNLRFQGRAERDVALQKMSELQKSIDGWEGKTANSCNEFIIEGTLTKYVGKKPTERYVFLFDGLIILTKPNTKRSSVTGQIGDFKLKEKCNIRKLLIVDREDSTDTPEIQHAFELQSRDQTPIVLAARSAEEKSTWMAHLVSLQTRSMLERMLDTKLQEEEKQQPLRLPDPSCYRFAVEDSDQNIVFEDNNPGAESPLIKGGTLVKLVERLTYHMYADPKFVRTFLTTYRTFCKTEELLTLLIERFEIPDPPSGLDNSPPGTTDSTGLRDYLKRFRQDYAKPVQFRVLNVLRHWVDQHWYDFELDEDLLAKLEEFLDSVRGKAMKKWVESITKIITRKRQSDGIEKQKQITFVNNPPAIEWYLFTNFEQFDLMTLHPIEIARQVTLLEFDLYRAVKPSEMVGSVWMKESKNKSSPNLLRMIDQTTRFTFWLEKSIIETMCFEERVAVMSRILEIMIVFQELNNFNGVLEVICALASAPVHRLEHTFEEVDQKHHKLIKAFDDARELNSDHFKKYYERLRSINPPCVPFLGNYLTNILLTEEGNPDFLPNRPEGIINFSKRRKVSEITSEIQQYQNQPYCLNVQNDIRAFFEQLDPLEGRTEKEFNDYLYAKSLEIEPRNSKQPAKFERKYNYPLKSPGIKPTSERSRGTLRSESKGMIMSISSTANLRNMPEEENNLSCGATPPTPSTPLTPPHDSSQHHHHQHASHSDTVFANVLISQSDSVSLSSSMSMSSNMGTSGPGGSLQPTPPSPPPPLPPSHDDIPPPLPPRRSMVTASSPGLMPQALVLDPPPHLLRHTPHAAAAGDISSSSSSSSSSHRQPPPLPPRQRVPSDGFTFTPGFRPPHLSRISAIPPLAPPPPHRSSHVVGAPAPPPPPPPSSHHQDTPITVNGDLNGTTAAAATSRSGSRTPELPPRTYKAKHNRKQSR